MKKNTKLKKNVYIFSFFVVFVFLVIFSVASVLKKIVVLNKEKNELKEVLYEAKEEKKYLESEVERFNDEEYVARFAREKYLFSKEGEYIIKIEK